MTHLSNNCVKDLGGVSIILDKCMTSLEQYFLSLPDFKLSNKSLKDFFIKGTFYGIFVRFDRMFCTTAFQNSVLKILYPVFILLKTHTHIETDIEAILYIVSQ